MKSISSVVRLGLVPGSVYVIPGLPKSSYEIAIYVIKNTFGITENEMVENTRKEEIRFARQVCMVLLNCSGLSLAKSGLPFNRDHATVLHSRKVISNIIEVKYPKQDYDNIIRAISQYRNELPNINLSHLPGDWSN